MLTEAVLTIDRTALEWLVSLLLDRAGLKITPDGYYGLKLALSSRMPALGIADANEYVRRLDSLAGEHELRSLLPLVTVGKTDFFRDGKQFQALERRILPEALERAKREGRKAKVWSAGCATGEEPYSLAMLALELSAQPDQIDIWATDLNLAAVESAKMGRYPARRLQPVSPERLRRFFLPVDDGYEVAPALRELVRFDGLNLAAPVFPGVQRESMDVILCRNVIIYFDLPTIRGLMDRFLEALRPGGVLLLGYSESLFKVYDRFEMFEVEGAFAYRRPAPAPEVPGDRPVGTRADTGIFRWVPAPPPRQKPGEAVNPIQQLKSVASKPPPAPPPKPKQVARSPVERLEAVVAQMNRGDFESALDAAQRLVEDEPDDLAALLTLGNLLSLMGRIDEAREAFVQALQKEPLCVEARVFGGVAALQGGDLAAARSELQKALFLEPTLALGHYLLAQVQERLGDFAGARRSYRNAVAQLRFPQRPMAGHYPDLPEAPDAIARAARYALATLEEL